MEKNDLKQVYNYIYNDPKIIQIYDDIDKIEARDKNWAYHNIVHINNVLKILEKILSEFNVDESTIYEARIACVLHDIGVYGGKDNHAERSYLYAKQYFKDNNILLDNENLILEAIKGHSDGFDTDNIIALALILADKLDIKKTRITETGMTIEGNRQLCHIEDIDIEISKETLFVKFISDGKMNLKELNNYYFIKKVFTAIEKFASKFNLKYCVLLDNAEWKI